MEFGKVDQLVGIDFHLPKDHPQNRQVLLKSSATHKYRWQIGLTGWSEPSWRGDIYPPVCKPAYFLRTYAMSYSCVELNSTFYHIPTPDRITSWVKQVPEDFLFYPKVWQGISHRKVVSPALLPIFQEAMKSFGTQLGSCFLQLPPTIDETDLSWLRDLLTQWQPDQQLFVEIRNPDLIRNAQFLALLQELRIGLVLTDVPGHRDLVHMCLTIPSFMLRFVAVNNVEIDRTRIQEWHERLALWASTGLQQATVFCHAADNHLAPQLSRMWLEEGKNAQHPLNFVQTPLDYRTTNQRTLFD